MLTGRPYVPRPPPLVPRPRRLTPRSSIAVAAPASAALQHSEAEAGLDALRRRGLTVEAPRALNAPHGFLSGPDTDRVGELNALFRRDDIDAVLCLRGGTGSLRLLDRLDYEAAREHPKLLVGYSDITALHLALLAQSDLLGLSAAMIAPDWHQWSDAAEAQFWALAGGEAPIEVTGPDGERLTGLRDGSASGRLIGGNLSLIAALVGTPYLPDLTGAILFVEDVGEAPYRIDNLFTRLHLAGELGRLGGLVVGCFTHAAPRPDRPSFTMDEVIDRAAGLVNGPVATNLVYGHMPNKTALPVGVHAALEVTGPKATLTVIEPLTA